MGLAVGPYLSQPADVMGRQPVIPAMFKVPLGKPKLGPEDAVARRHVKVQDLKLDGAMGTELRVRCNTGQRGGSD